MGKHYRFKIRKENELYSKKERKIEKEEELVNKFLPFVIGVYSIFMSLYGAASVDNHLTYFLIFSLFFIVASVVCIFIIGSKLHSKIKNNLLLCAVSIYLFGVFIPMLFNHL